MSLAKRRTGKVPVLLAAACDACRVGDGLLVAAQCCERKRKAAPRRAWERSRTTTERL
jgi:hypothetical protein